MSSEQGQAFGDGYFKEHRVFVVVVGLVRVHYSECYERSSFPTFVESLHGCKFHRLYLGYLHCGTVTCENGEQYSGKAHDTANFYGLECKVNMLALEKIPGAYA